MRLSGNGPRTRTKRLIEHLGESQHDVTLITLEDVDIDSVTKHTFPTLPSKAFQGVDVVHVPVNWMQVGFVRAFYHGPLVIGPGVKHDLRHRTGLKVLDIDYVVETHEYVAYLWQQSGYEATHIYPGVDRDRFSWATGLGEGALFVGALNELKGAHLLPRIAKRIDGQLKVIGDGPYRDAMVRCGEIDYRGYVANEDLATHYQHARVTILPSHSESFSNVALESIASGTPVITTTKEGSMVRLFKDTGTYYWVERDPNSIAKAIDSFLRDDLLVEEYRERGRQAVEEMGLTAIEQYEQTMEVYKEVLDG